MTTRATTMSGVIQECNMMFEELTDDPRMLQALENLKTTIESFLSPDVYRAATDRAQCMADAYADVYWLLQAQR